jgi:hypothetical protein
MVIDTLITNLLEHEIQQHWTPHMQIPICQCQLLLTQIKPKNKKKISFTERYNTHVTRSIRSLVQEIWLEQGILWGDFQCKDVNCGVKFYNTRLDSNNCLRCGSPVTYLEKLVTDTSSGFSANCHAVVYSSELDGYLLFDINTRNSNIITKAVNPYSNVQLRNAALATILAKQVRIVGRVILWVGKPRPKPYKFWFYEGVGEDIAEEQFKIKADLDQKLKEGKVTEIKGCCETTNDAEERSCPFAGICLSPARDRLIEEEYKGWLRENGKSY